MSRLDFLPTLVLLGALIFGAAASAATPQQQSTTLTDASISCGETRGTQTVDAADSYGPYGPYGYLYGLGLDRTPASDGTASDCASAVKGHSDRL
jgi:hypothetical protein